MPKLDYPVGKCMEYFWIIIDVEAPSQSGQCYHWAGGPGLYKIPGEQVRKRRATSSYPTTSLVLAWGKAVIRVCKTDKPYPP